MIKLSMVSFLALLILSGCDVPMCSEINGLIHKKCIPTENLNINSKGGYYDETIFIASRVQDVHVIKECHSACVMIVSRGNNRSACHDAIFGLHRASTREGNEKQKQFYREDSRVDAVNVNYLIDRKKPSEMYTFGPYTAKYLGLIDEILQCD